MTYHNTTEQTGAPLAKYIGAASNQDDIVAAWFKENGNGTPSQASGCLPNAPLTSVRRSINTLTKDGKLAKTGKQVIGPYGRPECVWRWFSNDTEGMPLFDAAGIAIEKPRPRLSAETIAEVDAILARVNANGPEPL